MLELDAMHRSGERLDARLRSLVRWAAADALGCAYSKSVAVADLKRAGFDERVFDVLAKNPESLPALDRLCADFARKIMRDARSVTDAHFRQMVEVAVESARAGVPGVVGQDQERDDEMRTIEFARIAGGKAFDTSVDWFQTVLKRTGQL